MASLFSWSGAMALTIGLALGGCSYDPKFADGTLRCSSLGQCPDGYTCRSNACFADRMTGPDGGAGGSDVGSGGGPDAAVVRRYVGTWLLAPTSMVVTRCGGGSPSTGLLSPVGQESYMEIRAGIPGQSDLESDWLCDNVGLRLDGGGSAHLSDNAPTCSPAAMPEPPVKSQTWTITKFDITGNNGSTASHTAHYLRVDTNTDNTTVNCVQDVTASLIKQP